MEVCKKDDFKMLFEYRMENYFKLKKSYLKID